MATELNLSANQFIILAIILMLALTVLWLKKSYFQLDIEPKTDTVTDNTTRNVGTRYGAYIQSQGKYYNQTEIIDLFGRKKELETLSATLVTITDMEDTDTDVVPEIVEIIKQLLDIIKTQQQSIENLACIAEKTIQLERGGQ